MIAGLQRRLRLLRHLDRGETRRIVEVAPSVVFYRVGLHLIPFRRLARLALRPPHPLPIAAPQAFDAMAQEIASTSRAVTRTSALLKGTTTCLAQALAVVSLLRRRGVAAELCVGVARDNDPAKQAGSHPTIAAHAWVEVDSHVVHGDTTIAYQRFPSLEALLDSGVS